MRESFPQSRCELLSLPCQSAIDLGNQLPRALSLTLPYHQNINTRGPKGTGLAAIPRHICSKFRKPKRSVVFWCGRSGASPMSMPEAAMHEYGQSPVSGHQIWASGQPPYVVSNRTADPSEQFSNDFFAAGPSSPDRLHYSRPVRIQWQSATSGQGSSALCNPIHLLHSSRLLPVRLSIPANRAIPGFPGTTSSETEWLLRRTCPYWGLLAPQHP